MSPAQRAREIELAMALRRYDFLIRSVTTSFVALMIVGVCCYVTLRDGEVGGWLAGVGAGVIGYYIGGHTALNSRNMPRTPRANDPDSLDFRDGH